MTGERRSSLDFAIKVKAGIQTMDMISLGATESLSQALGVARRGKGQRYAPGQATASGEKAGLGAILEIIVSERNARAIPLRGKWGIQATGGEDSMRSLLRRIIPTPKRRHTHSQMISKMGYFERLQRLKRKQSKVNLGGSSRGSGGVGEVSGGSLVATVAQQVPKRLGT
ncbi:hypothetical protein N7523_006305 [Penicillium sp. IBT 18751x]|nr:hypothetical protein N7523_006305 [Penicillium sp. IBT 18751x]